MARYQGYRYGQPTFADGTPCWHSGKFGYLKDRSCSLVSGSSDSQPRLICSSESTWTLVSPSDTEVFLSPTAGHAGMTTSLVPSMVPFASW